MCIITVSLVFHNKCVYVEQKQTNFRHSTAYVFVVVTTVVAAGGGTQLVALIMKSTRFFFCLIYFLFIWRSMFFLRVKSFCNQNNDINANYNETKHF